jgi:hypothetical protein
VALPQKIRIEKKVPFAFLGQLDTKKAGKKMDLLPKKVGVWTFGPIANIIGKGTPCPK